MARSGVDEMCGGPRDFLSKSYQQRSESSGMRSSAGTKWGNSVTELLKWFVVGVGKRQYALHQGPKGTLEEYFSLVHWVRGSCSVGFSSGLMK
ncbi:hypothetical protein SESBI_29281 [Sesbania bispinosa]|nr:hypothetical protein SESBI_29281 [Sesbania bispinosa]